MVKGKRILRSRTNDRLNFTPLEESILIDFVKKHPVLYDMKNNLFRNATLKKKLWNEIASELWKTGSQCSIKWRNIRDYYMKIREKRSVVLFPNQWTRQRNKQLEFLNSFIIDKKLREEVILDNEEFDDNSSSKSSVSSDNNVEDSIYKLNDPVISVAISQKNKLDPNQKYDIEKRKSTEQLIDDQKNNSLDQFFASMCGTVKMFSAIMQAQAKMKIAQLIGEMEMDFLDIQVQHKHSSENCSREFSSVFTKSDQ